ncbi:MAG: hypothetical protein ACD_23C00495G0003 [uncultured bacterium]|nr:MAG: hypothetical protein ACD_23C00495G0003 [uncultured bacterium]
MKTHEGIDGVAYGQGRVERPLNDSSTRHFRSIEVCRQDRQNDRSARDSNGMEPNDIPAANALQGEVFTLLKEVLCTGQ